MERVDGGSETKFSYQAVIDIIMKAFWPFKWTTKVNFIVVIL